MTDILKALSLAKYRVLERAAFQRIRAAAEELQARERELLSQKRALEKRCAAAMERRKSADDEIVSRSALLGEVYTHETAWRLHEIDKRAFLEKLSVMEAAMPAPQRPLRLASKR